MGEEDKLAREGSEERRIMGSRREPLISLSAGGDRVGRPTWRGGGEVEVLERSVKVAAPHTSRGRFIHMRMCEFSMPDKVTKCLYCASAKKKLNTP